MLCTFFRLQGRSFVTRYIQYPRPYIEEILIYNQKGGRFYILGIFKEETEFSLHFKEDS